MSWYMGMENVPAGKSMYTVHFTFDPEDTPVSQLCTEELDIILPHSNDAFYVPNHPDFQREMQETYGDKWSETIIVGVINQSDGYVMFRADWNEAGNQELPPHQP